MRTGFLHLQSTRGKEGNDDDRRSDYRYGGHLGSTLQKLSNRWWRCQILGLVDIVPERAREKAKVYGLEVPIVSEYRALLDDPNIHLVSIATPPSTHAEIAIACLRAGKHVLVEKPMAASLEECDQMIDAAQASGHWLSVVAQNRFRTPMMNLKKILDSGVVGPVVHAAVESYWWRGPQYYDLWWRGTWESEGGGVTLNMPFIILMPWNGWWDRSSGFRRR